MTEETAPGQASFARRNRLWLFLLLLLLLLLAAGLCASQVLGSPGQPAPTATTLPATEPPVEPTEAEPTRQSTATSEPAATPTTEPTATEVNNCNGVLGISHEGGPNWTVSLDVPDVQLNDYFAGILAERPVSCQSYAEYPDRIFCELNGFDPGSSGELTVFDGRSHLLCRDTVNIPVLPTQPPGSGGSSNGGGTCSPPDGGCTGLNCIWNPDTCTCEFDGSCIN